MNKELLKQYLEQGKTYKEIKCICGASKLIKNSIKHINSEIITWSDIRWTEGELYRTCGFEFDGDLKPDYSYIDKKIELEKVNNHIKNLY